MSGSQPKWLINIDLTDNFKELPRLQEIDKERQKREESQQKEENEKMKKKKKNPEDLTIQFLGEILDEMGELYSKSWKKGVLIKKVRAVRGKANNTTCPASV